MSLLYFEYKNTVDDIPFTLSPFSGVSKPEPALIISLMTPPSPPCNDSLEEKILNLSIIQIKDPHVRNDNNLAAAPFGSVALSRKDTACTIQVSGSFSAEEDDLGGIFIN